MLATDEWGVKVLTSKNTELLSESGIVKRKLYSLLFFSSNEYQTLRTYPPSAIKRRPQSFDVA